MRLFGDIPEIRHQAAFRADKVAEHIDGLLKPYYVQTLCMIFFCLGSILAGILAKYMPAQRNLLLAGALFLTDTPDRIWNTISGILQNASNT